MTVRELINMAEAANTDAKSAKLLSDQLKRMTGATKAQSDSAEAFIQRLSLQTGIIDDQLRPSLTELAAGSKDVKVAQDLLVKVLDISAGRGKSVEAVQKAVSKAYSGNTTALQRMFPEMKKVADKFKESRGRALTFKESLQLGRDMIIQLGESNKNQAANMATPFDKMQVAMDNLKENIGGALLPVIEKIIPKIQEMVKAFGTPGSPESKALKDMGDSLLQVFTDIDNLSRSISGQSAIVAFLDSIKNFALGTSYVLESLMAIIDKLHGKEFDPNKYKTLATVAAGNKERYASGNLFYGNRNVQGVAPKISNTKNANINITINGVVGDKVAVGKTVKEAMKAYESRNN